MRKVCFVCLRCGILLMRSRTVRRPRRRRSSIFRKMQTKRNFNGQRKLLPRHAPPCSKSPGGWNFRRRRSFIKHFAGVRLAGGLYGPGTRLRDITPTLLSRSKTAPSARACVSRVRDYFQRVRRCWPPSIAGWDARGLTLKSAVPGKLSRECCRSVPPPPLSSSTTTTMKSSTDRRRHPLRSSVASCRRRPPLTATHTA